MIGPNKVEIKVPIGSNKKLILVQTKIKTAKINNSVDQNNNFDWRKRSNINIPPLDFIENNA